MPDSEPSANRPPATAALARDSANFSRIVVPLDGSPLAEEALPTALVLAKRLHVPIHVITVIEVSGGETWEVVSAAVTARRFEESVARLVTDAQGVLACADEWLDARGVVATTEVLHGSPGLAIVDAVRPGDLIVMTSHGRTGLARWFLGSVAEAVVRHSPSSVLLVRATPASAA